MMRAAPLRRLGVLASHVAKEEERHNGSNGKQLAHDKKSVGISSKDLVGAEEKLYAKGWPESLPPPQYKQVPRFPVGDVGVLQHLEDHGFAVVADVLSPEEVSTAISKLWDFMEGMGTGIDRDDITSWTNDHWMENSEPGSGLMSQHGLGHAEALWYVRGIPKLKDTWATVLGDDDLIVSFDGTYSAK